jgi:hypothetical protein
VEIVGDVVESVKDLAAIHFQKKNLALVVIVLIEA